jgi:uracil-DNA glycosylase
MEQIPQTIHPSWHKHLQVLFDDPKMILIKTKLLPSCRFYPAGSDIFNVFKMPLEAIKVVILGQDPYINRGEAIGYAFAIPALKTINTPPSLTVIKNEIISSGVERDTKTNIDTLEWRELKHWRQQGVFLLNTALTVQVGESNSHTGQWSWFTREVIKIISLYNTNRPIWLLWGRKAKDYKGFIHAGYSYNNKFITNEYNYTLEANHPAAETRPDSKYLFTGCNHFKLTNQLLKHKKQTIINW